MKTITRDDAINLLREKGLKLTGQRLAILDVLVEQCEQHRLTPIVSDSTTLPAGFEVLRAFP